MTCFWHLKAISDDNFHVGFNKIYDKNLARSLRKIFQKHAHLFKGLEDKYDLDLASSCTSIRDFDDAITRRTFGEFAARSVPLTVPLQRQHTLHLALLGWGPKLKAPDPPRQTSGRGWLRASSPQECPVEAQCYRCSSA